MNTTDHPKHYCGVFGIFGGNDDVARQIHLALEALQHRGQESSGMVLCDGNKFLRHVGMGLAQNVFTDEALGSLHGSMGIGHNRYSTTGSSELRNAQPLQRECSLGPIAIGHNGQLTNTKLLQTALRQEGAMFETDTDSEVMLHILARELARDSATLEKAIDTMVGTAKGAYSLVILTKDTLIGVRDPNGFRPLVIGRLAEGGWALASETCALDQIEAEFIRDVLPGEAVFVDKHGLRSHTCRDSAAAPTSFCAFEHIYFARPNSKLGSNSVYSTRIRMGEILAEEHKIAADIVVPIPDSGNCAALGYSSASGIPYVPAFIRNHYSGRSFLVPNQKQREAKVRIKLSLVDDLVRGKRVIVVDDSVVRGTTSKGRIGMLRTAGAKEVHLLLSCPPHKFSCHYGIDFPDRTKLIAVNSNNEEMCRIIDANSIGYLSGEGLIRAIGTNKLCLACFNGVYPVEPEDAM